MFSSRSRSVVVLAAAATLGVTHAAQAVTYLSDSTSGGSWSDPSIWNHSPMPPSERSPGNGSDSYHVTITEPVSLDVTRTVSSLSVAAGSQLTWSNPGGSILTLDAGPISNHGLMSLNAGDSLGIGGLVALGGNGAVTLGTQTSRITDVAGGTLQINGHTIRGQGFIEVSDLTNDGGTILADMGGQRLTLDPGGSFDLTGGGVFRATSGGILRLSAGVFNAAGGTIDANGGSTVELNFATITFGALNAGGGSQFRVLASSRLNSVNIAAGTPINLGSGATLRLAGNISNNGQISVQTTPALVTTLGIDGAVTLAGTGSILLDDPNNSRLTRISGDALLIQQAGHTIEGTGSTSSQSAPRIDNRGRIVANRAGLPLRFAFAPGADSVVNTGTMLATSGGVLSLIGAADSVLNNTGGLIEASDGSSVNLSLLTISGGELHSSSSGSVIVNSEVHLRDLTHSANTRVAFSLFLNGQINNDAGIINVADSGDIYLDGDTTLAGTGDIALTSPASISKLNTPAAATLNNTSNLIRGAGNVGGGQLSVINAGTIDARINGATLTLQPAPTGSFSNSGTLMASDGGILFLQSGSFENTRMIQAAEGSQVIIASGSNLYLDQTGGGTISAGTNATVEVRGNAIIDGGKLLTNTIGGGLDLSSRVRIGASEPRFHEVINEGHLLVNGGNAVARNMVNKGLICIEDQRTLTLEQSLVLDGSAGLGNVEIIGGTSPGLLQSVLRIRDTVTLSGTGAVLMTGVTSFGERRAAIFGTGTNPTLINAVSILGEGRIASPIPGDLTLINTGTIAAVPVTTVCDGPSSPAPVMELQLPVTNQGTLSAGTGGTLRLTGAQVNNPGGVIQAADGGVVDISLNPTINGGTLQTSGSGVFRNSGSATLGGSITNRARIETTNGAVTRIAGGGGPATLFRNSGTILLNSTGAPTTVNVGGQVILTGGLQIPEGVVQLSDQPNNQITGSGVGAELRHVDHTIRGAGIIGTNLKFVNGQFGKVIADGVNPLTLVYPGGQGTNAGGTIRAAGGGGIMINAGSFSNEFASGVFVEPGSKLRAIGTVFENKGRTDINGVASITLFRNVDRGFLTGVGVLNGNLLNSAEVAPGNSPGLLTVNGNFTQDSDGVIEIELGGVTPGVQLDGLNITGAAALDGTLAVQHFGEFVALPGQSFQVMTFGSRSGDVTIANRTGRDGLLFNKVYDATSLTVVADAKFAGDADLNGRVDVGDLGALASNWQTPANWLGGDFDGSGVVDINDLGLLASNWQAGASALGGSTSFNAALASVGISQVSVPEPHTLGIISLGITSVLFRRRR
jgi:hypothetical protein